MTKIEPFLLSRQDLKVLYVEDSEMVRESTCDILDEFFDSVDIAIDGEKGLNQYQQFYEKNHIFYDIVLTDINMPKMNGIEMIEHILKLNPNAHIIVMSAHNEPDYLLKLINLNISNFILKPIEIQRFESVIEKNVNRIINEKKLLHYQKQKEEIHQNLEASKALAEKDSAQKSQFLANMSHEIRTPLNAIIGFISILDEQESDPEKLKYLKIIKNSSNSLLQIISDILDISKIESGKFEIDPVDFNPYEELIMVGELFQSKASQEGIKLTLHYNKTMPQTLHCDVLRIKQILSNLLSNAIKFTPKGGKIKCIMWYHKGRLNIRVKDYGIGIDKESQKRIFNAFEQIEGTTKTYGGTGLGLAISQELTHLLGGTLTLKSQIGKGSDFLLSLKMAEKETPLIPTTEVAKPTPKSLKGHILLVEDYEANRMFVGIILNNAGITYDIAKDGIEAIEKVKTSHYDLILMDENMPRLGGIGATKSIREREKAQNLPHTPIISLTANALKGDKERFLDAGMDDYLSKPVEPMRLMNVLHKFLLS